MNIGKIIRQSLISWIKDDAPSMGAAIAFYMLFAIGPILLILIWTAGMFVGPEVVQSHLLMQMRGLLGDQSAAAVHALLISVKLSANSRYSAAAGVLTVLIGASSVFAELQNALNRIWRTPPRGPVQGAWDVVRARLLTFGFLVGIGLLLMASLTADEVFEWLISRLPILEQERHAVALAANALFSCVMGTLMFAMIYRYVPNETITWGDIWVGSSTTAALYVAGKLLIVTYLSRVALHSAYGIAGSFLLLMLWVYYSAQIFLLGAEFTREYAHARASRGHEPDRAAVATCRDPSP